MENVTKFAIADVLQINLPVFQDGRGFFKEIVRINEIEKQINKSFVIKQANHARSAKNTLRGIHVAPWNKIIYVTSGSIQSVIVDCRKDSPSFGKYESLVLGDENRSCIFIPANCGNAYLVLSENADYIYLTDREWEKGVEKDFQWNDPTLGIKWMIEDKPLLSLRDKNSLSFRKVFP